MLQTPLAHHYEIAEVCISTRGTGFTGGKARCEIILKDDSMTSKDKITALKKEYGTGGYYGQHASEYVLGVVFNSKGASIEFVDKSCGESLTANDYTLITYTWPQILKILEYHTKFVK